MPIYSIQAPNGKTYRIEGPEGASQDEVIDEVLRQHPESGEAAKPKEGILAALGKGAESYASQVRTALQGPSAESAEAGIARGKDINTRYANQADPEKVIEAYQKDGALSALGTAVPMVPYAIAEQAPTFASAVAGAQLGQKLGTPFGGAGRLAGAGLGALVGRFAS